MIENEEEDEDECRGENFMDYGKLLRRALNIVIEHKYLILLGALAALGGGVGNGNNFTYRTNAGQDNSTGMHFPAGIGIPLIAFLIIGLLTIFLLVWVIAAVARGGLVAGVNGIESGATTNFSTAWNSAWSKVLTLAGIALVPLLPLLVLAVGLLMTGMFFGLAVMVRQGVVTPVSTGFWAVALLLSCLALPFFLGLSLLRTFAERACMLENLGVWAAYQRSWAVIMNNLGPVLLLFFVQIGLGIGLAIVLFVPSVMMTLLCIFWPVLWLIQGAIAAFFSTLWTLAWREWTGLSTAYTFTPIVGSLA